MAKPGPVGFQGDELRTMADWVMNKWNPYAPYVLKKPNWFEDVRFDSRPQTWSFRDTQVRVEKSIEIPYLVWYPVVNPPDPNNATHWPPKAQTEQLLIGFVGAGGW